MPSNDPLGHTSSTALTESGWSYYGTATKLRILEEHKVIQRPLSMEIPTSLTVLPKGIEFNLPEPGMVVEGMFQRGHVHGKLGSVLLRIRKDIPGSHEEPTYLEGLLESLVYIEWVRPVVSVSRDDTSRWVAVLHLPGGPVTPLALGSVGDESHSFGYVRSYLRSIFLDSAIHLES